MYLESGTLAGADHYDRYRDMMAGMGIVCEPPAGLDRAPRLHVTMQVAAPLVMVDMIADAAPVYRSRREISRSEWGDQLWVYRERAPGAWFDMNGQEVTTAPGDLLMVESETPWRTNTRHHYRHQMWVLPIAAVRPHLPSLPRPLAARVPARSAMAPLLTAYFDALAGQLGRIDPVEAALLADNLGRLLAIACGSARGGHRGALRAAKLEQARTHIDRHLTEELSAEAIARTLGISLRQLHLLFEPSGESLGQYVRRRRLQECRATLESPLAADKTVAEIAFSWGFPSLPSFYRAFGEAFGAAPGDIRWRPDR